MSNQEVRSAERVKFSYHTIRTISCPDDKEAGRQVFCGHAPARSFVGLPDDDNVRTYIVDAEGKKRKRLTDVHREIRETLKNRPEDFSILNSGIVIVARSAEADDKNNLITLVRPSIINGSQSQGELSYYLEYCNDHDLPVHNVHAKFEIIVCDNDELIADISISRNFQNDVARISIAGRRQQLEGIETSLQSEYPDIKLRKSETDRSDDFYDSEKLIQVITALTPSELWLKKGEVDDPRKGYTYSGKSKCLKEFQDLHNAAQNPTDKNFDERKLYQFFTDITPTAYSLYESWKSHQAFNGTRLRALERDESGNVTRVPDGIIFPILAALSVFMRKVDEKWQYAPPKSFVDNDIVLAAISQYQETAKSNPTMMGKTQSVYSSLHQLTSIFRRLDPS